MLKRFVFLFIFAFANIVFAHAETLSMQWLNEDGSVYTTSTCESGGDIILPATPTKNGYTFMGWNTYTPIEYLQSTGTQYIDTGFAFNDEKKFLPFVMDFTVFFLTPLSGNTINSGFCGATPNVMKAIQFSWNDSGNKIGVYVTNNNTQVTSHPMPNVYGPISLRLELNSPIGTYSALYDNETLLTGDISNGGNLSTSNNNLYLFKANGNNSGEAVRIYKFSYELNGIKIRDFIPVLDGDGVPCMYDKVTRQFFYNQGTGQFIAGPVLNE